MQKVTPKNGKIMPIPLTEWQMNHGSFLEPFSPSGEWHTYYMAPDHVWKSKTKQRQNLKIHYFWENLFTLPSIYTFSMGNRVNNYKKGNLSVRQLYNSAT